MGRIKLPVVFWVLLHAVLIGVPLLLFPVKINTDLYSVLPASHELREVSDAERVLSARTTSQFYVLVGDSDFTVAKSAAEKLYSAFAGDSSLQEISLYAGDSSLAQMQKFLYDYRYVLQAPEMRAALASGDSSGIRVAAANSVYGAFSLASLSNLAEDPFLLGGGSLERYMHSPLLSGNAFSPREGVLSATKDGAHYVMLRGSITPGISGAPNVIGRIESYCGQLKASQPGLRVAYSGVPFHSYESAHTAQGEIAVISIASLLAVVLLLLYVFRSPFPLFASVGYIVIAALTAFSCTLFAFREIHVFTFVFGTSLIGVCIDYAVHFFVDYQSSRENKTGFDVRRHIAKGIFLGFLTTEAGYAAVMLAPFPLLRQMALFSFTGLLSSFISIMVLFPNFKLPPVEKRNVPLCIPDALLSVYRRVFAWKRPVRIFAIAAAIVFVICGLARLEMKNDIRSLYSMPEHLKRSEALAAQVLNSGASGEFFIIAGKSEEDVLEREETFTRRLDSAVADGALRSYLATSLAVPSLRTQQRTYADIGRVLLPSAGVQLKTFGFGDAEKDSLLAGYARSGGLSLTVHSAFPQTLAPLARSLWIGKVGDRYYSAVLPLHIKSKTALENAAKNVPSVYFVDKLTSVGDALTRLSHIALALMIAAYVLILVVLSFVYGFRNAVRVICTPLAACVLSTAALGLCGIPFNFFAIVGVILTLSIGIDYSLFFKERFETPRTTMLAVLLSVATTLLSFGALSLSSFAPVSTFGFSVLFGITFCFLLAPFNARGRG